MSRSEVFAKAYPDHEDANPMFEAEYRMLREFWDEIPEELRDQILEIPPALKASGEPDPLMLKLYSQTEEGEPISSEEDKARLEEMKAFYRERAERIRTVDQRYRYRTANDFALDKPDIFRRVMMFADDAYMFDLLFFGTMTALSACMPGVKGSYDREIIQPNLFLFVTGNAASGKGRIGLCRKLLEKIHKHHEFFGWQFILPANSSDTAIYAQLAENRGHGIIFETEADTLSNALGKASGKFGEGLRKAFHNETISYMRRTNNEQVVINHPVLSVLLTGTPMQLARLIPNPEDGLFSRFLFYRLSADPESFPPQKEEHRGITGEMVDDYMQYLGEMVKEFFERLRWKSIDSGCGTSIRFRLSEEQEQQFQQHFNKAAKEYRELFLEGYQSEERAAEAKSIMHRLGNICYRMMMVLTVSRLITEEEPEIPDELVCDQRDFDTVIGMEPMLRFHNHLHYDEMLVNSKTIPPMNEENNSTGDMLTELQRLFFEALPDSFTRKEALQVAEDLAKEEDDVAKVAKVAKTALPERTITRYLKRYCELGVLNHVKQGRYEKVEKDGPDTQAPAK